MPYRKVMAFFMHEKEEAAIKNVMTNAKETESFMLGELDDADIERLRKVGILIDEIKEIQPADTDQKLLKGLSIPSLSVNEETEEDLITIAAEMNTSGFPAYYTFQMDDPMLEEYRQQIHQLGAEIIEFIPLNTYIVKLTNFNQYNNLAALPFVKTLTFFSSRHTKVIANPQSTINPIQGNGLKIVTYDLLLHSEADLPQVEQWLTTNNVLISGAEGNRIRIFVLENSTFPLQLTTLPGVKQVEEFIPPVWHNDRARDLLGIDAITAAAIAAPVTYTGKDQVIGVADTGIDDTHADFQGQLATTPAAWGRVGDYSDFNGHGSHVAGSIVGNGHASGGSIKGTAPGAKLFFQSVMNANGELNLPLQLSKLFDEAYGKGVRIHNNSWGSSTNSRYTVNAIEVDEYVWRKKDMLLVFSAGNDGKAEQVAIHVLPSYPELLTIGSPASAKNVLTVGASRSDRTTGGYAEKDYGTIWPRLFPLPPFNQQKVSGDKQCLAGFSSRGPCDDYRVKPDLVAPGTDIVSIKSARAPLSNYWGVHPTNASYAIMGGTSMSAPLVAGCAALVREYYQADRNHAPSAALLKATLINGTTNLGGADVQVKSSYYNEGFGCVNMLRTIPNPAENVALLYLDTWNKPAQYFVRTGQRIKLNFKLSQKSWLKICLCYTDYPGRALQNNLNLLLDYNVTNQKWLGNSGIPSLLSMLDTTNNVEVIGIAEAESGNYTVQVVASNLLKTPQDCALVITSGDNSLQFI